MKQIYSVLIGGKAGEGVKKTAQVIAHVLMQRGWHVFQQDDYQSLIKGGHNFSTVSFSSSHVHSGYNKADLVISFDQRSLDKHWDNITEQTPASIHCYNSDNTQLTKENVSATLHGFPFTSVSKQLNCHPSNITISAIALFFCWMGWDEALLIQTIKSEYKRDIEENTLLARAIFKLGQTSFVNHQPIKSIAIHTQAKRFISGNQAIALGAWTAGLDFYYAYPMTPASSILHYLALKQHTHKVYAIHAESELAAANMAIGSVFAGAKTAVGSSGGGVALMREAFSLAGMVEAPLLCILSSRPGPATGVSTYTAQEDLNFALAQGHGEFGRIVASPDSISRAFSLAAELLCLAWEFQNPVILLCDKHLSESSASIEAFPLVPSADEVFIEPVNTKETDSYARYAITDKGVSPLLFPGADNVSEDTIIKWNSNEHVPSGLRTDAAENIIIMKDKRNRKTDAMYEASKRYQRISIYGDQGPLVFAYGSTTMELLEAQKHCKDKFRIVSLIYLLPFPLPELTSYMGQEAIVVEHNSTGSFAKLLVDNLNISIKKSILRYDGRTWDPIELSAMLEGIIHA